MEIAGAKVHIKITRHRQDILLSRILTLAGALFSFMLEKVFY
jgi:hypothetical protein